MRTANSILVCAIRISASRGGRTRTAGPRVPNAVRYRTALRPGRSEYKP